MQWEVVVPYKGQKAYYRISSEKNGIYQAHLLSYDGSPDFDPPPSKLLFLKGARQWVGSAGQADLLNELGKKINYLQTSEDFVTPDSYMYNRENTERTSSSPDAFQSRQS